MSYFLEYKFGQSHNKTIKANFNLVKLGQSIVVLGFIDNKKAYKIILNSDFSFHHFEFYQNVSPFGNYAHHQLFYQTHFDLLVEEKVLNFSKLTESMKEEFCLHEQNEMLNYDLNTYFDFDNKKEGIITHDFVYHGHGKVEPSKATLIRQDKLGYLIIYGQSLDEKYLKFTLQFDEQVIHIRHTEIYHNIFNKINLNEIVPLFSYQLQRKLEKNEIEPILSFNKVLMASFCIDNFD